MFPQAPVDTVPMPVLSRPPTISPNVAATMSPPTKANRVQLQDEPDADPDEDERPQAPQASDLVIGQVARSNGERDRPGEDQEDAPAQVAATHMHTDNGSRRVAGWQRPNVMIPALVAVLASRPGTVRSVAIRGLAGGVDAVQ